MFSEEDAGGVLISRKLRIKTELIFFRLLCYLPMKIAYFVPKYELPPGRAPLQNGDVVLIG